MKRVSKFCRNPGKLTRRSSFYTLFARNAKPKMTLSTKFIGSFFAPWPNKSLKFGLHPNAAPCSLSYSSGSMTNSYVIKWRSLVNGRAGKGTRHFAKHEAEQLAEELNREYPQIQHEAIPVSETESQSAPHDPHLAEAA
jgi:hypothetical protein